MSRRAAPREPRVTRYGSGIARGYRIGTDGTDGTDEPLNCCCCCCSAARTCLWHHATHGRAAPPNQRGRGSPPTTAGPSGPTDPGTRETP